MSRFEIINPRSGLEQFHNLCALGIMTKAPEAGKVKTRLTPPLTSNEAAALNECFLRDLSRSIADAAEQSPARGVAIYTPVGKESVYDDILAEGFVMIPQRGDGFGERLSHAVTDLLSAGFGSVCLINSDSPTVPAQSFAEAATELAKPGDRIVLGPSDDGGYYLIGLKKPHHRIFEDIDWSTERVLAQTLERAKKMGVPVHQLSGGYDVDDGATLQRLSDELLKSDNDIAPHSRKFLQQIIEREGRDRIWRA
ncbi:MAG TPA: TIGR04282 family arsenosugar biosynthesis glycosyltransferase [Chthoniobacterales bacterium]|nr:TIGR04282 family arsenosugar biosynthesis glycosyltransferase [Chthoniobacterales bacterium]